MSNFGFQELRVVEPYNVAFREARSAIGASEVLAAAKEYKTVAEAVFDCGLVVGTTAVRHRELQHSLRRLQDGARLIRRQTASNRVALLFGSEKRGLSNEDLSACHWLIRIPTREDHSSMNLGQAAAVCLYEFIREAKSVRPIEKPPLATGGEVERITTLLYDALCDSGYIRPSSAASSQEKIRRLVRRLRLNASDAEILLGMLRQIMWKLRSG